MQIEEIRQLIAEGKSGIEIARLQGIGRNHFYKLVKQHSLGPWPKKASPFKRKLPADFIKVAPTISREAATKYWGCGMETLNRWYRETNITPSAKKSTAFVLSANNAKKIVGMTVNEAANLLGVHRKTAIRLMRENGITPAKAIQQIAPKETGRNVLSFKPAGSPPAARDGYNRDMSIAGQAADALKKYGPIFREGNQWRRGNALLSDEEVIERATWKGWKPVGLPYSANRAAM